MFNHSSRQQRRSNQGRAQRLHSFSRSWQRTVLAPAAIAAMLLPVALAPSAHASTTGGSTTWQVGDGNWNTAANWSQGIPNSTTDASNTTSSSITSNSDGNVYNTFSSSGTGNFSLSGGSLTGGAFFVNPSALFQISGGATLRNATVSGAPITFSGGGVLDNVTANSNLNLSSASATIVNGLILNATANVTGGQGLYLSGAQTIGGTGTIRLGASTSDSGSLLLNGRGGPDPITLGPGITVDALGGGIGSSQYGTTLLNQGTLQANGAGRTLGISTNGLVNNGAIVANGAGSTVTVSTQTTGSGTVSTGAGGTVTFSGGSAIQQAAGTS